MVRPASTPVCGRTHVNADDTIVECAEVGDHLCEPRALHVCQFFEELLVHTKGAYARKRFALRDWQREDILRPLFGSVVWSVEHERYVRQYRIAYLEVARKNGKSQLLAGIMLYLLFADDEESAEIFSVARDRAQAGLVFDVASRMVMLSPLLSREARVVASTKRIVRPSTNSVYRVIAADAGSALGSNPSGVAADEILAWNKPDIWDALRSGMGSADRMQPLMVAATTAPADSDGFGGDMHREMLRVVEDPARAPHVFPWIKNLDLDADIYDESNWYVSNPALGDFLSLEEMRRMSIEARNSPIRELAFRRFQLNQVLASSVHWMPMHLYDATAGTVFGDAESARNAFAGGDCWLGVDLAARQDLTSICYLFPAEDGGAVDLLWRHFMPQAAFEQLNRNNGGRLTPFVRDGWLVITEGDVLDFEVVYDAVESDALRFTILGYDVDQWSSDPVIQEIGSRTRIRDVFAYSNTFAHMSDSMHRIYEMVTQTQFRHHGDPVVRWNFDCAEALMSAADPDLIKPAKIKRGQTADRIDAVASAIMAVNAWWTRGREVYSVYEDEDLLVL